MADDMKRLETELKKGVNKRNAVTAMGSRGGKGTDRGCPKAGKKIEGGGK